MRLVRFASASILVLVACACDEAKDVARKAGEAAEEVANDPKVRGVAKSVEEAGKKAVDYIAEKGKGIIKDVRENIAYGALEDIVDAGRAFASGDLDGNGINDYWTADVAGFYCLVKEARNTEEDLRGRTAMLVSGR